MAKRSKETTWEELAPSNFVEALRSATSLSADETKRVQKVINRLQGDFYTEASQILAVLESTRSSSNKRIAPRDYRDR